MERYRSSPICGKVSSSADVSVAATPIRSSATPNRLGVTTTSASLTGGLIGGGTAWASARAGTSRANPTHSVKRGMRRRSCRARRIQTYSARPSAREGDHRRNCHPRQMGERHRTRVRGGKVSDKRMTGHKFQDDFSTDEHEYRQPEPAIAVPLFRQLDEGEQAKHARGDARQS